MNYVISIRIHKELKELMDSVNVDWSNEIRKYIEEKAKKELKKKFIDDARKIREKIGIESGIPSYKLIREDREHGH